jgi:hypothetical protein
VKPNANMLLSKRTNALVLMLILISAFVSILKWSQKQYRSDLVYTFLNDMAGYAVEHNGSLPSTLNEFINWSQKNTSSHWSAKSDIFAITDVEWGANVLTSGENERMVIAKEIRFAHHEKSWNKYLKALINARFLEKSGGELHSAINRGSQ